VLVVIGGGGWSCGRGCGNRGRKRTPGGGEGGGGGGIGMIAGGECFGGVLLDEGTTCSWRFGERWLVR